MSFWWKRGPDPKVTAAKETLRRYGICTVHGIQRERMKGFESVRGVPHYEACPSCIAQREDDRERYIAAAKAILGLHT